MGRILRSDEAVKPLGLRVSQLLLSTDILTTSLSPS